MAADLIFSSDIDLSGLFASLKKTMTEAEKVMGSVGDMKIGADISGVVAASKKAEEAIKKAADTMGGAFDSGAKEAAAGVGGFYRDANGRLRDMNGKFIKSGDVLGDSYAKGAKEAGDSLKGLAATASKASPNGGLLTGAVNFAAVQAGVTAVSDGVKELSQGYVDLDTATQSMKTLGPEGKKAADNLREAAIQMSKELPHSAAAIQQTMFDAMASGVKGGEEGLKKFGEIAGKLATGGGSSIGEATGLLAGQLNAYGASSEEAAKYADTFFNTVNYGVTSVKELSSTLSNVVPTAAAAGVEMDQVGGALAQMTQKGIPTAQATTKLNQLLIEMQKPGKDLEPILQAAGVSLESLKNDDLPTTLGKVKKALDATGGSAIQFFSSSEAAAAFDTLSGDMEGFAKTVKDVSTTTGSTENAYKEMSESVAVQTDQMMSKIQAFQTQAMEKLGPGFIVAGRLAAEMAPAATALGGIALAGTQAANSMASLGVKMKDLGGVAGVLDSIKGKFGGITSAAQTTAANAGDALGAIGKNMPTDGIDAAGNKIKKGVGGALDDVGKKGGLMGKSLGGSFGSIMKIAGPLALIGGLVAILVHAYQTNEEFRKSIDGLLDTLQKVASDIVKSLQPAITALVDNLAPILSQLGKTIGTVLKSLAPVIGQILGVLGGVLGTVLTVVGNLVKALLPAITSIVEVGGKLLGVIGELIGTLVTALVPVFEVVGKVLNEVGTVLGEAIGAALEALTPIIMVLADVLTFLVGIFADGLRLQMELLLPIITILIELLSGVLVGALQVVAGAIQLLVDGFQGMVSWLGDAVGAVSDFVMGIEGVKEFFTGVTEYVDEANSAIEEYTGVDISKNDGMWETAGKQISIVAKLIGGGFKSAWEWLVGAFETAINWVREFIGNMSGVPATLGPFEDIVKLVSAGIKGFVEWLKEAIGTVKKFLQNLPIIGGVVNKIGDVAGLVKDKVGGAIKSIGSFFSANKKPIDDAMKSAKISSVDISGSINQLMQDLKRSSVDVAGTIIAQMRRAAKQIGLTKQQAEDARKAVLKMLGMGGDDAEATTTTTNTDTGKTAKEGPDPFDEAIKLIDKEMKAKEATARETIKDEKQLQNTLNALELEGSQRRLTTARDYEAKKNKNAIAAIDDYRIALVAAEKAIAEFRTNLLLGLSKNAEVDANEFFEKLKPVLDVIAEVTLELATDADSQKVITEAVDKLKLLIPVGIGPLADMDTGGIITKLRAALSGISKELLDSPETAEARSKLATSLLAIDKELAERTKTLREGEFVTEEERTKAIEDAERASLKKRTDAFEEFIDATSKLSDKGTEDEKKKLEERIAGYDKYTDIVTGALEALFGKSGQLSEEEEKEHQERLKEIKEEGVALHKAFKAGDVNSTDFIKRSDELAAQLLAVGDNAASMWDGFKQAGLDALKVVSDGFAKLRDEGLDETNKKMGDALTQSIAAIAGVKGAEQAMKDSVSSAAADFGENMKNIGLAAGATLFESVASGANALDATIATLKDVAEAGLQAFTPLLATFLAPLLGFAAPFAAFAATKLLASLMKKIPGFEKGGIIEGGRQIIQVNERGKEAILNAQATAKLGRAGIDALNKSDFSFITTGGKLVLADSPAVQGPIIPPNPMEQLARSGALSSRPDRHEEQTAKATAALVEENRLLRAELQNYHRTAKNQNETLIKNTTPRNPHYNPSS